MRVPLAMLALAVSVPAAAADVSVAHGKAAADPQSAPVCRHDTQYLAGESNPYRGKRLMPRKLTELPPGTAYMAVYRHIGGCEAPLTMVEYRGTRQH